MSRDCFVRRMMKNIPRPMRPSAAIPPTTPPTMAPVGAADPDASDAVGVGTTVVVATVGLSVVLLVLLVDLDLEVVVGAFVAE